MRINADTGRCVGAGQCVLTEPDVFDQDDDGIVLLLADEVGGERLEQARTAVQICPSAALSLEESG
ncbi:ferredoxin [Saccharopolyspora sp. NPDC047091]|uniref:ferredoxin n=1 Tax=Saccharopolyspora sp. NPDC047091 TaxID=3155924 RepID=UPI0033CB6505